MILFVYYSVLIQDGIYTNFIFLLGYKIKIIVFISELVEKLQIGGDFMSEEKNRYDLTSADAQVIGFDFQYFYFINEILKLEEGQLIGFEVKDDIHIELPSGKKIITQLVQLKHTIQKNVKGTPINLTNSDIDLWKSLSNWCKVICDKSESRITNNEQLAFLGNTEFILATNKNISGNKLISYIREFVNKRIKFSEIKDYLINLKRITKDQNLKKYMQDIFGLSEKVLESFIGKLNFIDTGEEIIKSIKVNIQRKMIASNRVNDVFNDLFSVLKQDFFNKVYNGNPQIISFDEWIKNYTCIFERNRDTTLPIRTFKNIFNDDLCNQNFIKELIEIGEICPDDLTEIAEFSEFMLNVQMNLNKWRIDGEITEIDLNKFHKESIIIWKNSHKRSHRTTKKNFLLNNDNSLVCLDDIRNKKLKMLTTELGWDLSNGEFYHLSNEGKIGWKIDWEAQYKNGEHIFISKE